MSEERFTQDEVDAFSAKLDEWGGTLPERERTLLHALLVEAENYANAEEADVAGFGFGIADTQKLDVPDFMKLPTLDKLAGSALRPVVEMENSWKLRAYDRWNPTQ